MAKEHPTYERRELYRDVLTLSSEEFREKYLYQYSKREKFPDFFLRKRLTCVPTVAKTCLLEVANTIYDRLPDVSRISCPSSYTVDDVDMQGTSMTSFMGAQVAPELLAMGRVGIFVDMPNMLDPTLGDDARPYCYVVKHEDLLNWSYINGKLDSLLISSSEPKIEDGLIAGYEDVTLLYRRTPQGVSMVKSRGEASEPPVYADIMDIPCTILELRQSLLEDAAIHQVTLLNLNSADIHFIHDANFPIYLEQYDPHAENFTPEKEVTVGPTIGRRYPVGLDAPTFIHPSSDPLQVGMNKQDLLAHEVRKMMHLALDSIRSEQRSEGSRKMDSRALESGLASIGSILERAERFVLQMWNDYTSSKGGTIQYPRDYALKSTDERLAESGKLYALAKENPSPTFQRECLKAMSSVLFSQRIPAETLQDIHKEIDEADVLFTDPDTLRGDVEAGLATTNTVSRMRGYATGEAEKAQLQRAERAAQIVVAQSAKMATAEPGEEKNVNSDSSLRDSSLSPDNKAGTKPAGTKPEA